VRILLEKYGYAMAQASILIIEAARSKLLLLPGLV
jgi:hypothetical protein